ncbi:MAG: hypothetical protein EOR25_15665 [Mesorhizobium sp.]|uniref:hypothetical protein n=1 Tax=Mesorhizobium sp. TaxID=1871066 RepID=UPI000FE36DCA|nr:hypothetical protein [Mesorhizobium sp.]RWI47587.1 MAG: hypothetical protein EOR15_13995 [Mesorhizobium sp.]RWI88221.1 MAG: hypothetical protein EOR20_04050 [Mesorhizobium sp.]RWJ09639.1 MAG: hypothetical protein EOR24_18305 [Mesorhizobium sp.]RWJ16328.1 MAG: hypothetical protein EOR25_15665 [Mesorhizobium sp.]RWJ56818.1 MAG: hypothetical protein EOR32_33260 [Mesorhizobium sp.]
MIVYNIERGWFPMKNDADAHRRRLGLKPAALATVRIESREELAAFLNALMGLKKEPAEPAEPPPAGAVLEPQPQGVQPEVIERNYIEVPDFVPMFLAKKQAGGKEIRWITEEEWNASLASCETSPGS